MLDTGYKIQDTGLFKKAMQYKRATQRCCSLIE